MAATPAAAVLANYHHCEDHTITQTARYPSVHPTKQTSWQTSTAAEITPGPVITPRPASKTSEMLNISEHPQSRRRLGWHRWRRIFLPSEKINRSRIMSFNTVGSWTQACTNEVPQHSSRCPADQWDSWQSRLQYQGPRHLEHLRQRALCSRHHTQSPSWTIALR